MVAVAGKNNKIFIRKKTAEFATFSFFASFFYVARVKTSLVRFEYIAKWIN
jgi:hypothetical protein